VPDERRDRLMRIRPANIGDAAADRQLARPSDLLVPGISTAEQTACRLAEQTKQIRRRLASISAFTLGWLATKEAEITPQTTDVLCEFCLPAAAGANMRSPGK
jgi:hypothetical protein